MNSLKRTPLKALVLTVIFTGAVVKAEVKCYHCSAGDCVNPTEQVCTTETALTGAADSLLGGGLGSGLGPYGSGLGPYGSGLGPYGSGLGPYGSGLGPYGSGLGPYGSGLGPYGKKSESNARQQDENPNATTEVPPGSPKTQLPGGNSRESPEEEIPPESFELLKGILAQQGDQARGIQYLFAELAKRGEPVTKENMDKLMKDFFHCSKRIQTFGSITRITKSCDVGLAEDKCCTNEKQDIVTCTCAASLCNGSSVPKSTSFWGSLLFCPLLFYFAKLL